MSDGLSQTGRELPLGRLGDIATAHAMTVHRSQGSQFGAVTLILPDPDSPLLTRELFYTAVTRAQHSVQIHGSIEAVRTAIDRPAQRATGLAGSDQRAARCAAAVQDASFLRVTGPCSDISATCARNSSAQASASASASWAL